MKKLLVLGIALLLTACYDIATVKSSTGEISYVVGTSSSDVHISSRDGRTMRTYSDLFREKYTSIICVNGVEYYIFNTNNQGMITPVVDKNSLQFVKCN